MTETLKTLFDNAEINDTIWMKNSYCLSMTLFEAIQIFIEDEKAKAREQGKKDLLDEFRKWFKIEHEKILSHSDSSYFVDEIFPKKLKELAEK